MEHIRYPKRNPWPSWWSRHETTLLLGGTAIVYVMYTAWIADQPPIPALGATIGVLLGATIRMWLEERTYRSRLVRTRRALKRTGRAVGRLLRQRILFRDVPAAHPGELTTSIVQLARGQGPAPDWSAGEATRIREGIENLLTAFAAEVGRQVAVLPPSASKRLDTVDDEVDSAAEKLLVVATLASDIVDATWAGAPERLRELQAARQAAVESALEPLRRAVTECEWLIGAADA